MTILTIRMSIMTILTLHEPLFQNLILDSVSGNAFGSHNYQWHVVNTTQFECTKLQEQYVLQH